MFKLVLLLVLAANQADCAPQGDLTEIFALPGKALGLALQPGRWLARWADLGASLIVRLEGAGLGAGADVLGAALSGLRPLVDALFRGLAFNVKTVGAAEGAARRLLTEAAQSAFKTLLGATSFLVEKGGRLGRLPFVRAAKGVALGLGNGLVRSYGSQIGRLARFAEALVSRQPWADSVAARILLLRNFLHAFINGNLVGCPGDGNPFESPAGTVKGRLHTLIEAVLPTPRPPFGQG